MGICVGLLWCHDTRPSFHQSLVSPAYIAGVTNPIFEASRAWDVLLVIGAGSVTVAKDIHTTYPVTPNPTLGAPLLSRTGTVRAESSIGSEDDIGRSISGKEGTKADNNVDRIFIEDVSFFPSLLGSLHIASPDPDSYR